MSAIATCRTAALGGHVEQCTGCRAIRVSWARAEWLEARQAELLPVPYFHVVFTVPAPIAPRCSGSAAMVRSVSAVAWNSMSYTMALFWKAISASAAPGAHRQRSSGRSRGALLRHTGKASHGGVTQTKRPPANPGRFKPLAVF
jgi:hypothetical protein